VGKQDFVPVINLAIGNATPLLSNLWQQFTMIMRPSLAFDSFDRCKEVVYIHFTRHKKVDVQCRGAVVIASV